jgi:23S rRNA pseudouridine2605 synthase
MTNDTRLADWLTDPANRVVRRYVVTVRGAVSDETAARLVEGIDSVSGAGGCAGRMAARSVEIRKRSGRETHLTVELTEGKNREVRRLFASVGHEVTRLKRVAFGGLELGSLAPGESRELDPAELSAAFPGAPRAHLSLPCAVRRPARTFGRSSEHAGPRR